MRGGYGWRSWSQIGTPADRQAREKSRSRIDALWLVLQAAQGFNRESELPPGKEGGKCVLSIPLARHRRDPGSGHLCGPRGYSWDAPTQEEN